MGEKPVTCREYVTLHRASLNAEANESDIGHVGDVSPFVGGKI